MKRQSLIISTILFFFLSTALFANPEVIPVGEQFYDTSGNLLQAHGGGICYYNGYYYWIGENRSGDILVSCYRSTNFKDWEFRNHILRRSFHSELANANIERPKVVYNPQTNKFIMWAHKELTSDYGQARAAVAVCDTIDGNYTWQRSFRPLNHMSRDCTLFIDDDGRAYFISAANENYDLHIYRLTSDFLDIEALLYIFDGDHREAPAIFKYNGTYFLVTSGATGWDPNQGKYSTAQNLSGPWSGWQNFGNGTTFESQPTYIQPIQGSQKTSYLYLGDRWAGAWGGPVNDSKYVWLPINLQSSSSISISYSDTISIDTDTGIITNGEVIIDPANVAYNKPAAASSEEPGNPASNGNDGITGTRWCATNGDTGQWWRVDLQQEYTITEVSIRFEFADQYQYIVEASTDNNNWSVIIDQRSSGSTAQVRTHGVNTRARYIRITYTGLASGRWASHYEFSVRSENQTTPDPTPVATLTPAPTNTLNLGDVNSDNSIDIVDALLIAQYYVGLNPPNFNPGAADTNCDGNRDIVDALLIAQFYVGLITQFC
ncbi:MAG: discoidin domain-containing protein [Spirochaetales bacterium]|nr:discoidin domain-containing protein [Spirochaetales bacterium]